MKIYFPEYIVPESTLNPIIVIDRWLNEVKVYDYECLCDDDNQILYVRKIIPPYGYCMVYPHRLRKHGDWRGMEEFKGTPEALRAAIKRGSIVFW